MSEIALLPRVGLEPVQNLRDLVDFYINNSPFQRIDGWSWGNTIWDVKGVCKSQARKANYEHLLYFSRDNGKGSNVKTSRANMEAFHSKSLSEVVKCHVTHLQIESSKDFGTLQILINAYRYLDNVMSVTGISVHELSVNEFKLAEKNARSCLADSTFYRAAQKLVLISKFINGKCLARQRITFKKNSKRSATHTNSDTRIDKESIDLRAEKLPSKESLIAIATLSNATLSNNDKIFQAIVEIIFSTGLRFDEVIALDVDCLYVKEVEEKNTLTGHIQKFSVHELRYKSKKGGGYRSKVIADSLVPILQKGIKTAQEELQSVRDTIHSVLAGEYDFFPKLDYESDVFVSDIWKEIEWSSRANFSTYIGKLNVNITKHKHPRTGKVSNKFSPKELKDKTLNLARLSVRELWNIISKLTISDSLEKMLFISQHQKHHSKKSTEYWNFTLIAHTQFSDYLAGRADIGVESVFERYNLMFENTPIRLTSHQFRHFLNTMVQLSDSVSEIEVARYFGRKYMGDNETYDHTNKEKRVMDHADDIIASHGITKEQAKEAAIVFTLVDKEEAIETVQDLTTTLITSIGICSHDYNDSPCGKHYACLRGCSEYYRTKGDKSEVSELNRMKEQQMKHIEAAKEAVIEEYHGANNWLLTHEELLTGCVTALEIEHNEKLVIGEKIQVFPEGDNGCRPL